MEPAKVCKRQAQWNLEKVTRCGLIVDDGPPQPWTAIDKQVTCVDCLGFREVSGFQAPTRFRVLAWGLSYASAVVVPDSLTVDYLPRRTRPARDFPHLLRAPGPPEDRRFDGHVFKLSDREGRLYFWATKGSHNLDTGVRFQVAKYRLKAVRTGFPAWISQVCLYNEMPSYPPVLRGPEPPAPPEPPTRTGLQPPPGMRRL